MSVAMHQVGCNRPKHRSVKVNVYLCLAAFSFGKLRVRSMDSTGVKSDKFVRRVLCCQGSHNFMDYLGSFADGHVQRSKS